MAVGGATAAVALTGCLTSTGGDCSILSAIKNGYGGIALDNTSVFTQSAIWGHYYGAVAPCAKSAQPVCGGTPVGQYNGNGWAFTDYGDTAWQDALIGWVQYLHAAINGVGGLLFPNIGGAPSGAANIHVADIAAER